MSPDTSARKRLEGLPVWPQPTRCLASRCSKLRNTLAPAGRRCSASSSQRSVCCPSSRVDPFASGGDAVRRGLLHHGSLLVHGIHVICESGGDVGTFNVGYIFGHSPC